MPVKRAIAVVRLLLKNLISPYTPSSSTSHLIHLIPKSLIVITSSAHCNVLLETLVFEFYTQTWAIYPPNGRGNSFLDSRFLSSESPLCTIIRW